jgi:hypothetical protein
LNFQQQHRYAYSLDMVDQHPRSKHTGFFSVFFTMTYLNLQIWLQEQQYYTQEASASSALPKRTENGLHHIKAVPYFVKSVSKGIS